LPVTTYVITTAPLGPVLADAVAYNGAVSDTDLADNHYRIVEGDRLMWSGRATTWARNASRYVRSLKADIRHTYPQLRNVAVDYAWSGTLGNSVHRMPQIGELGPGVWLASGFGGHGLNTTAMAGNVIARAIVDGDQTWRQFNPFELIWAGGVFGRATVQVGYWIKRIRDAQAERHARQQHAARRRTREGAAAEESVEAVQEAPERPPESLEAPPEAPETPPLPELDPVPASPKKGRRRKAARRPARAADNQS
jgi:hypothetical protein